MDFNLSDEQAMLRESVRHFAAKELKPTGKCCGEACFMFCKAVHRGWELPLLKIPIQ